MKNENYFKDVFECTPDYRKIVLLIFLIIKDTDLLKECGFLRDDINRLNKEFKNILIEQNEEYLDHTKNQEDVVIKKKLLSNDFLINEWNNILL